MLTRKPPAQSWPGTVVSWHPYLSLKNLGKKVCIIHSKIRVCLVQLRFTVGCLLSLQGKSLVCSSRARSAVFVIQDAVCPGQGGGRVGELCQGGVRLPGTSGRNVALLQNIPREGEEVNFFSSPHTVRMAFLKKQNPNTLEKVVKLMRFFHSQYVPFGSFIYWWLCPLNNTEMLIL